MLSVEWKILLYRKFAKNVITQIRHTRKSVTQSFSNKHTPSCFPLPSAPSKLDCTTVGVSRMRPSSEDALGPVGFASISATSCAIAIVIFYRTDVQTRVIDERTVTRVTKACFAYDAQLNDT